MWRRLIEYTFISIKQALRLVNTVIFLLFVLNDAYHHVLKTLALLRTQ